jgi:hypothetical protein
MIKCALGAHPVDSEDFTSESKMAEDIKLTTYVLLSLNVGKVTSTSQYIRVDWL